MNYLDELLANFNLRIDEILGIGDINEELIKIAVNNLQHLKRDIEATGRNAGLLQKVNTQLEMYTQVALLPQLKSKYPILRGQIIVLIIGAMEAFLTDIFRSIADNEPERFVWVDSKEKISFEPTLLSTGFSIGDAFIGHLKNKNYSFQDLKSSLEAIQKYLGVEIELGNNLRDKLILGAAYRNVIVHNKSKVDLAFLSQIRDTQFADSFKQNEVISISGEDVSNLRNTARTFAAGLIKKLNATP